MFIQETERNGRKYLSIAHKVKNKEGKLIIKEVADLGYLDELKKIKPDPKQFFQRLVDKVMEEIRIEEIENEAKQERKKNKIKNLNSN